MNTNDLRRSPEITCCHLTSGDRPVNAAAKFSSSPITTAAGNTPNGNTP